MTPRRGTTRARALVLAKAPLAGRVKTRLCPPCTPAQAATLAEAALRDTLAAVAAVPGIERVLVLDGAPGPWLPPGFKVIGQRRGSLGERLAGAFADAGCPAMLVGMDTPQITAAHLTTGLAAIDDGHDAVIGPAADGGYWGIGLRSAHNGVFRGVPMSTPETFAHQLRRMAELGLHIAELPELRDVDDFADAQAVAAAAPRTRFAAAMAELAFDQNASITP